MSLLDKLLATDAKKLVEKPQKKVEIKRLSKLLGAKAEFTCQALDPERYTDIQRTSIDFGKKGGIKDLDLLEMQTMTLVEGIIEPSMKNRELMKHYSATTPKELVKAMFLPGEITELSNVINELSGYESEDVETEIKN